MFQFPYTNFHELNMDWILHKLREMAEAVQGLISEVESTSGYPSNAREIFTDKKVLVIGDSISNTSPSNWVQTLETLIAPYGATVTNMAVNGDSFCNQWTNGYTQVLPGYDIVILALGMYDYINQYDWSEAGTPNVPAAVLGTIQRIKQLNPDAKLFYFSPIKNSVVVSNKWAGQNFYTGYFERVAAKNGFQGISGYALGQQAENDTRMTSDGLLPSAYGAEVIGKYVFDAMCIGSGTFTPTYPEQIDHQIMDGDTQVGYISTMIFTDGHYQLKLYRQNIQAEPGETLIYSLPHVLKATGLNDSFSMDFNYVENHFVISQNDDTITYHNRKTEVVNSMVTQIDCVSYWFTHI